MMENQVPGFFGGDSGITYEELQARKRIARELMGGNGQIRTVGEGISSAAGSIAGALMNRRARKAEDKMRDAFNAQFEQTVGPQAAALSGLTDSPFANDAQKKMIVAALAGVPQYARGTPYARGGVALVGEDGPEFVNIPRGAQVIPVGYTNQAKGRQEWYWDQAIKEMQQREMDERREMVPDVQSSRRGPRDADPFVENYLVQEPYESAPVGSDMYHEQRGQMEHLVSDDLGMGQQFETADDPTLRKLAEREIGQRNAVNALQQIFSEIEGNPQLLDDAHTTAGRTQTGMLRLRDRLGIDALDISPEGEKRIGDVAAYRQKLLTNVNEYIKEITGATVGQGAETTRLMAVQPNEDDSPTEIVAKLRGAIEMGMLNAARFRYMQSAEGDAPTDREMREILSAKGAQYYNEALQSGASDTDARMQAAARLSEEYGI